MDELENVDTSIPPDDSGQDTGADTGADVASQVADTEPPQPPQINPDEIVEKAFQRTASWMGRRDKDLIDNISNIIDARIRNIVPPQAPPQPMTSDPAALLENPDAYLEARFKTAVPRIIDQEITRRTQREQAYFTNTVKNTARLLDSDPLFDDKALGAEVVAEIQARLPHVDKRLPEDVQAKLLVSDSLAAVYRKQRMAKVNPLANNTPGKAPATQGPPAATKPSVKVPKLDAYTMKWAKEWGYKDEDIAKLYGEKA
jgi:hypothetical protein